LAELEAVESFNCTAERCSVKLKPLLVDYELEGFSPFSVDDLKKVLGLRPLYRYSQERLFSAGDMVLFYLKNSGFLDAAVRTELFVSKEGFARLKVRGKEGELYLWGGFNFKGACESEREFYRRRGKPLGTPFSYLDLYEALDEAAKACKRKGYFSVYAYYEEPFEVKRKVISSFLWKNFRLKPGLAFDFVSAYFTVLLKNPVKGVRFLLKPTRTVYPSIVVHKEGLYELTFEGVKFFDPAELKKELLSWMEKQSFVTPSLLARQLALLYEREGFLDVRVKVVKRGNLLLFKVEEGPRYRVRIKLEPPLLKGPFCTYYSERCLRDVLSRLERFLRENLYLYEDVLVGKRVDPQEKLVEVEVVVKGLKKVSLEVLKEVRIKDEGIRRLVEEKLASFDWKTALYEPDRLEELKNELLHLLRSRKCRKPKVEYRIVKKPPKVVVSFTVQCGGLRRFGPTVYWVEGRLPERELSYLVPDFGGRGFNRKLVDVLSIRLDRSGLFDSYTVKTVDAGDDETILLVEGTERKRYSFDGAFGFTSDEGYLFDGRLTVTNPLGTGERFVAGLRLTQERTNYELSYYDDYFFSKYWFVSSSLFKNYEEHRDYSIDYEGYSFTLGYHLNLYGDLSLSYASGVYSLATTLPERPGGNLQKLTLNFQFLYPVYTGSVKAGTFSAYANYAFGISHGNYKKATAGALLSRFFGRYYLELKGSAGWVSENAPIFEKFYLGGIKNLKGYSYESVAPPGGGELYWYAGFEVGLPTPLGALYLFTGADFGNAVKRGENPFKEVKKDAFVGLGTPTAVGPLRFVVAAPLEGRPKLSNLRFLLLVGFEF